MSDKELIQTVLGSIKPSQLGTTLCHEHLYHKTYSSTFAPKPCKNNYSHLDYVAVSHQNMWYTLYHPYSQEDNLDFTESLTQKAILEELMFFKANGGQSIVEVTTFGKDLQTLAKLSQESGVNIVGNTGYYIKAAFSDSITSLPVESFYQSMKDEWTQGVNSIKPGVIGELGSSWPIFQFEKNVLVAAAQLQQELKLPVIIHPGRNPKAPFEIMRIFTEAGGVASKTVMSHLDRTLNVPQLLEFAKIGAICELDLFGNEVSYYQLSDEFDMPNDSSRIESVKAMVDEGHSNRITLSHDIHTKHRLMKYGGHGFSHILLNVVPKMLKRGITQEQIDEMLIHTPCRWLTISH